MAALPTLLAEIGAGHTPWKIACRVVSTANITLSALQTIDSIVLAKGDRVLVAGQTDPKQNGIYLASANTWTRAVDMARSSYAMLGTSVRVLAGTANAGTVWALTTPTSGTIRIGVTEIDFSQIDAGGASGGSAATIPDATTATLTAKRGSRAALTRFRVQEITLPDGTVDGQPKTVDIDGDVFSRTRVINASGSTAAVVGGGRARLQFIWDATAARWNTSTPFSHTKLVRPEDFGPDVGIGDSAADTAAIQAMLAAVEVALSGYANAEAAGLVIEFSAPEYLLTEPIVFPGRWGWGGYEVRGTCAAPGGSRVGGVTLRYTGSAAVLARRATVTFNRAARTAVLSTGTWSGLGFAVGMRLLPNGTASNDRITKPIVTLVGATATFDAPDEATVAGFSTTGMDPVDEVSVVCDVVQFNPFVSTRAAWGVYIHDLKIWNATAYPAGVGLCSHGLWIGFEPDVSGMESSSGVRIERVDVFGARNNAGCSALLIGRPASSPVVGQQCDNIEIVGGTFYGLPILSSQPISVSGDTISTLATPGGASAAHTIEDHQAVVIGFSTGGLMAGGLDCKVYYARDVNQVAGTLKVSAAPGGAAITATTTGGTTMTIRPASKADAVLQPDGNNTKGIRFHHTKFSSCWSAYRCLAGFENLVFDTCSFDSTDSWAIDAPANYRVTSAIAERVNKFARAAPAHATLDTCSINAISLDDEFDGLYAESITALGTTYNDARTNMSVVSVNTGTDTLTVNVLAGYPPVDGRRVVVRSSVGASGILNGPAFTGEDITTDFFLRDVAHVAGAQYTCKLALSIGGAATDIAGSGAVAYGGVVYVGSELVPQAYRGDTAGAFVRFERCTLMQSGNLRVGVGSSAPNSLVTLPAVSVFGASRPRIVGVQNIGGPQGYTYKLPNVNEETLSRQMHNEYQGHMMLRVSQTSQSDDEQVWEGNFERWAAYMADTTIFFFLPIRVEAKSLWAEVIPDRNGVTGFASAGMTALTCSVGVYTGAASDGTLLPSFDLMAYSAKTITASSWVGGVATYTAATHKISAGDIVTVAGVTPSGYNATGRALTTAATWTRVTTTATVTSVAHGYTTGQTVDVLISSSLGAITLGAKTITVTGADTFTFTCLNAGAASGTLSMINQTVFKLQIDADPGGVGTVFGTVTVSANSRRRGLEPQTRGASAQTLPWRPIDMATPANHWTTATQTIAMTLTRTGGAWSTLTAGRLRLGFRLGRFSR